MSETLEDLEQRLGDGIVAKIAELLDLSPPQPLPRLQPGGDRDLIVRFLLRENENLLIEREHLRQVVLALAEATRFLKARSDHHAALCLVADFHWEQDQHGGGMKKNSFTLAESDGYRQRYEDCLGDFSKENTSANSSTARNSRGSWRNAASHTRNSSEFLR